MDVFGIGQTVSGMANAFGQIWSAERAHQSVEETNKTNMDIQRETNAANLYLAQQQNDWNIAQWQRENEYNSPLAQMQRFEAAGLNPNLIYGQGSNGNASHLTSANLANQQAAHVNPDTTSSGIMAQAFQALGDMAFKVQQSRQMSAQVDKTRAEAKEIEARTLATTEGNERARSKFNTELSLLGHQDDLTVEQKNKILEDVYTQRFMRDRYYPASIKNMEASAIASRAGADLNLRRLFNLEHGLPIDGGNLYERLISGFASSLSNGKIASLSDIASSLGDQYKKFLSNFHRSGKPF